MAVNPKIIVSVASVIGGGGAVPVILWSTGNLGGTTGVKTTQENVEGGLTSSTDSGRETGLNGGSSVSPDSGQQHTVSGAGHSSAEPEAGSMVPEDDPSSRTSSPVNAAKSGNCEVISNDLVKKILQGLAIREGDYIVLDCDKTGDSVIKGKWTGFFQESMFQETFSAGDRLNIFTETEEKDDESEKDYKTTFLGSKFVDGSVTGEWGFEKRDVEGKEITVVETVEDSASFGSIYLLFEGQKNQ